MTKFIFALETNHPDEIELLGAPPFSVVVSTNDHFTTKDYVQDDYEPRDYKQLIGVMNKYNLLELAASVFEPDNHRFTRNDITESLNSEPLFSYSQELQDFIDDHPNKE